jgi:hypothetical protein
MRVDVCTDAYSLGAVAYYLLVGVDGSGRWQPSPFFTPTTVQSTGASTVIGTPQYLLRPRASRVSPSCSTSGLAKDVGIDRDQVLLGHPWRIAELADSARGQGLPKQTSNHELAVVALTSCTSMADSNSSRCVVGLLRARCALTRGRDIHPIRSCPLPHNCPHNQDGEGREKSRGARRRFAESRAELERPE